MMARFTDNARRVVKVAFRHQDSAPERDLVAAMARQRRGLAPTLLVGAGVRSDRLPVGDPLDRREVLAGAVAESRRCGAPYVGTEHILLTVARRPGSVLRGCGASADRLIELLAAAEAEWRRTHPPMALRLGAAVRAAARWIRGRG